MNYRNLRVGNLIRDELAELMVRNLEFTDALVTLTDVEVDEKLDVARAKVSILPANKEKEVMRALKQQQGEMQHLLHIKLNIKPMPRLDFELDKGNENAARIEKRLIDEGGL